MQGMHVFGELMSCDPVALTSVNEVMASTKTIIDDAGLTRVSEASHVFANGGYTFVVCLAESHLAVHTWVDERMVTLDVFVCNVVKDQSGVARQVFDRVSALFSPENVHVQETKR
ncbi:MAG: S-adenosylmethionine decarboxylase [Patescibacteria group bacterium]